MLVNKKGVESFIHSIKHFTEFRPDNFQKQAILIGISDVYNQIKHSREEAMSEENILEKLAQSARKIPEGHDLYEVTKKLRKIDHHFAILLRDCETVCHSMMKAAENTNISEFDKLGKKLIEFLRTLETESKSTAATLQKVKEDFGHIRELLTRIETTDETSANNVKSWL